MRPLARLYFCGWALGSILGGCAQQDTLRSQVESAGVHVLETQIVDQAQVELGISLFFDRELSGNRDIACSTCHFPASHSVDQRSLPIGTGGHGLGTSRVPGSGAAGSRNTSDIFNRGNASSNTLFWDGHVEMREDGILQAPVEMPVGIRTPLEAQALLPIINREEMRGPIDASPNELALIPDENPNAIWNAVMTRLLSIPEYRSAFAKAFPGEETFTIVHVARAIAAMEIRTWDLFDTKFDDYLRGSASMDTSFTENERRGAQLFFGDAGCARCHQGPLFTDDQFHNIAVPQLGRGKDARTGLDEGRFVITHLPSDRFLFRTPPLRNVSVTGPWMHNGTFGTLESAVRHHLTPNESLRAYRGDHLSEELRSQLHNDAQVQSEILSTLDETVVPSRTLSDSEVTYLISFLGTLTSRTESEMSSSIVGVPKSVPSGLPVDGRN